MPDPYTNYDVPRDDNHKSVLRKSLEHTDKVNRANKEHNDFSPRNNNSDGRDPPGTRSLGPDSNYKPPIFYKPVNNSDIPRPGTTSPPGRKINSVNGPAGKVGVPNNLKIIETSKDTFTVTQFKNDGWVPIGTIVGIGLLLLFLLASNLDKYTPNHVYPAGSASRKNKRSSRRNRK